MTIKKQLARPTIRFPRRIFRAWSQPYRAALLAHCYRFSGSLDDAEDALQETLIRAWRRFDSLEDRDALRAWLYRIATNVSLDMLDRRKVRALPLEGVPPADPAAPLPGPLADQLWLDPFPDELIPDPAPTPEARYASRESVTLAFLALLQKLPGKQRAVLILRDVLGWRAQEVADTLELSDAAVNSALQRARATIKKVPPEEVYALNPAREDARITSLLDSYLRAWETADLPGLTRLLRDDAVLTMPPLPAWYAGRAAIAQFYRTHLFAGPAQGRFRLFPIRANGGPGFAVYQRDESGAYRAASIQLLVLTDGQVARIHSYLDPEGHLFARFHLPISL